MYRCKTFSFTNLGLSGTQEDHSVFCGPKSIRIFTYYITEKVIVADNLLMHCKYFIDLGGPSLVWEHMHDKIHNMQID